MSIPVLIVPTLNQPDALFKMFRSIDTAVDALVIIDNGGQVVDGSEGHMIELIHVRGEIEDVRIIETGHNIGVAASWNFGIKVTPRAPYWLIVNDDIEFGPGDLARLEETVDPGASAVYFMLGMAAFAITYHGVRAAGFADESFVNGYDEDLDWHRRMTLAGVKTVEVGFTGTHIGSATIHSDPELRAWNGVSHTNNDLYYAAKWGGPKQGGETFTTPFNRGGHLGDWRLDIERYRALTWPRSSAGRE